jgi:hypothetical protein
VEKLPVKDLFPGAVDILHSACPASLPSRFPSPTCRFRELVWMGLMSRIDLKP